MGKMPGLNIGGLEIEVPIVQGGMGVRISLSGLASAVANQGGVGNLASVGLGDHENFIGSYAEANAAALRKEIMKTRKMTDGVFGVNVMVALSDYDTLVQTVVEENVPLLFTGAGFDPELPLKLRGSVTMPVLVISYAGFIPRVLDAWGDYRPAAIVIEGPMAGGHLGYSMKRLEKEGFIEGCLEKEVRKAVEVVKGLNIPIIAAGGIYTGADIHRFLKLGASGVQMGTRFVVTDECDADIKFKEEYLRATEKDIVLIKSPVGFPGRVINNYFVENVGKGGKVVCPYYCLTDCEREEAEYCIAVALKNAGEGNLEKGFAFAGANAWRCNEIIPVKELMDILKEEYAVAAK